MEETINFLYDRVRALQKKVETLKEENDLLFDYADNKMVEGCEEATKLMGKLDLEEEK
tara:strand:+ start:316 stop:489 length:174 start_codon:yes stop_codon:yes gene_type:complete